MARGGSRNKGKTWSWTPEQRAALRIKRAAAKAAKSTAQSIPEQSKAESKPIVVPAEAKTESARPLFNGEAIQALLRAVQERQVTSRQRPRTEDWNPYMIRRDRFGPVDEHIHTHKKRLAMDSNGALTSSNQIAIQAWQAGGLIGNVAAEGLLFLGYPYLSELAQRPEFRLFGEIRAEEMTRKWTQLRGTDDESTKEKDKPTDRNKDDEEADRKRKATGAKPRTNQKNKDIEDKIKEMKDLEEELKVRDWFKAAAAQDSFFGISHLQINRKGIDPANLQDPESKVNIGNGRDKVTEAKFKGMKNFLTGFTTIEPIWVYPTTYNAANPRLPSFYVPQQWYVMGSEVHRSQLLSFIGRPVPDILKPAYAFGGLSMTQMAQPYVDIWLRTRESVGEIIHAFSVMVLKTDLATTTMPGGSGGGNGDVLARLALFLLLRDNQGVFAIDKNKEDFSNVSAPLSGLDELQAQAQEHLFSVGRIPAVKFAGIQPKGLNATSEGEMRAFNDTIHGSQEHLYRSHLTTVYDLMQYHLWGERDPDITYDFLPLQELTPKEKAEVRKLDAETDQIRVDSGILSQEEVRTKVANDPESGFHGINPEDTPDLLLEEEAGLEPEGGGPQPQAEVGEKEQGADGGIQNFDEGTRRRRKKG